jgi:hypothetical protein
MNKHAFKSLEGKVMYYNTSLDYTANELYEKLRNRIKDDFNFDEFDILFCDNTIIKPCNKTIYKIANNLGIYINANSSSFYIINKNAEICSICLDIKSNPCSPFNYCSHTYCENCINIWLESSTTCPECRGI